MCVCVSLVHVFHSEESAKHKSCRGKLLLRSGTLSEEVKSFLNELGFSYYSEAWAREKVKHQQRHKLRFGFEAFRMNGFEDMETVLAMTQERQQCQLFSVANGFGEVKSTCSHEFLQPRSLASLSISLPPWEWEPNKLSPVRHSLAPCLCLNDNSDCSARTTCAVWVCCYSLSFRNLLCLLCMTIRSLGSYILMTKEIHTYTIIYLYIPKGIFM